VFEPGTSEIAHADRVFFLTAVGIAAVLLVSFAMPETNSRKKLD
jgi:hypothetical protein